MNNKRSFSKKYKKCVVILYFYIFSQFTFQSQRSFKEHYKSHLGLEFKCDAINCKKSFPTKKRLYSHRKNVHDPQVCCELCKDLFTNKQSLNRHRKNV